MSPTSSLTTKRKRALDQYLAIRDRLPFVSSSGGRWALPPTGGYAGGCQTGAAAAAAYLKLCAESRKLGLDAGVHGFLQSIVLDMVGDAEMSASLKGQIVGFFSEVNRYVASASSIYNTEEIDLDVLAQEMRDGLDEAAVTARYDAERRERERPTRSAAAKKGWRTRRKARRAA